MDKIISINLAGRILPIEEDAFISLKAYLDSLRAHFAREESADEILADIEARMAELFNERLSASRATIAMADVAAVIATLGTVADIAGEDAADSSAGAGPQSQGATGASAASAKAKQPLMRDSQGAMLGGVCAGVAAYFRLDPAIVRVLFVVATLGGWGLGLLLYAALWIILPEGRVEHVEGKRLYRSEDHKTIGGVAGGLGAYFGKDPWIFRLIFLVPIVLGMGSGLVNFVFGPVLVFGSLGGTLVVTYLVLWAVVPLARTPNQKREMRGEPINLATIRDNVASAAGEFAERARAAGAQMRNSAQRFSSHAAPAARESSAMIGRIARLIVVVIGCSIALILFVGLFALIASGAPDLLQRYIFDSPQQQTLFWVTLILVFVIPIVGLITAIVRAASPQRRRMPYLGWGMGGLWVAGLVCLGLLITSVVRMVRYRATDEQEIAAIPQPAGNTLRLIAYGEGGTLPTASSSSSYTFGRNVRIRWNSLEDDLGETSLDIRVVMSRDSLYHMSMARTARGRNRNQALVNAQRIPFDAAAANDSTLSLSTAIALPEGTKYRGQHLVATLEVPSGKRFAFSDALLNQANVWLPDVDDMEVEPGEVYTMGGNWGRNRTVVEHSRRRQQDSEPTADWENALDADE